MKAFAFTPSYENSLTAIFEYRKFGFDHRVGHVWALRMRSESSNVPCSCQDDTRLCPLYL